MDALSLTYLRPLQGDRGAAAAAAAAAGRTGPRDSPLLQVIHNRTLLGC
jgi:hypothetical protein